MENINQTQESQKIKFEDVNFESSVGTFDLIGEDIVDIRDIIEFLEKLEENIEDEENDQKESDLVLSKWIRQEILEPLRGEGGNEEFEGAWYPLIFNHENYFEEYIQDLLTDCGFISKDLPPVIENNIDWEGIAEDSKVDYFEIELMDENGKLHTYYCQ